MKNLKYYFIVLLSLGLVFTSCGPDDVTLQSRARSALLVNYSTVSSNVRNGIVTLSGVVESEQQKSDAEAAVKSIDGVKSVVNEITVQAPAPVQSPDELLKASISVALSGAGCQNVTVDVKDSVVTLSGKQSKQDQDKILKVLEGIKTTKVVNDMTK